MNNCCYSLAIRQNRCQNGIPITSDNIYTNIEDNSIIELSYGYSLRVISRHETYVVIELSNPSLLPPVFFHIPNDDFKEFDLPLLNGTFILLIGAQRIACPCPQLR